MSDLITQELECESQKEGELNSEEAREAADGVAREKNSLLEETNRMKGSSAEIMQNAEERKEETDVVPSEFVVNDSPSTDHLGSKSMQRMESVLSLVSKKFDRSGKGYLDETEQALRALDFENKGKIDMEMAYTIMRQLLTLERSLLNMKRLSIVLACFTVILALSNLGTAFAAFYLARDTSTDSNSILRDVATGDIVKTESACPRIHLTPSRQRRMMLREVNDHEAQDRSLANNHNETGTLYAYYEATSEEHQIVSNSMDAGVGCLMLVADRTAMTIYIDKVSSEEQTMSMDAHTSTDPNSLFDFTVGGSRLLQFGGVKKAINLGGGKPCPGNRCRRRSLSEDDNYIILIEERN